MILLHIVIVLQPSIFIPYKAVAFSNVSAETAILMDVESGCVLYEKVDNTEGGFFDLFKSGEN